MEANPSLIIKASIVLAAKIEEVNYDPVKLYSKLSISQTGWLTRIRDYRAEDA